MNTALSWIKAYVPDLEVTDQEYMDAMTLSGTKVEGMKRLDQNLEKIVVGQIVKLEKHPDADKLLVCQVDVGSQTIQIVTGAHNISEGDKIPVVLEGGNVAASVHADGKAPEHGIRIKKGKLRGVPSFGMMCSIEELGSTREFFPDAPENGIYLLPPDTPVGADAVEVLGLRDTVFEYEITSNRVDCYSVLGIAREAAATFRKKFVAPVISETGNGEDVRDFLQVEVQDPDLCPRYCARMVKNIRIAPSPKWMQRRLAASGVRPINNLVDITNYVMEEFGQPMHAFDYDQLAGHKIVVKRAQDGDTFQTLDGQIRRLDSNMLMINDGEKGVCIAGIMGGENSKITDNVKTMVFEAACFDGTNVRLSSKRLGLRTESSGKFEKGLDPNTAKLAMDRACQLIEELGCGEVVGGMIDVYPQKREEKTVAFDPDYINALLGTDISREQMLAYFQPLELVYSEADNTLHIPTWRQDISCKADVAEEVARFYGYDHIPTTLPSGAASAGKLSFKLRVEETARQAAQFCGFSQAMTYSFESPKVFDRLLIPSDCALRKAIPIMNPLGEDYSIMRTTPLNGMLTSLATNFNRRNKNVRLYEIANVYLPEELPLTKLPDERTAFSLGMYGEGDFFTMKGVVEEFLHRVGMNKKIGYDPTGSNSTGVYPSGKLPFLHPGRQARIWYDGQEIGYLGEVHPQVTDNYAIGERVYLAVLDLPYIVANATYDYKYTGLAKYPSVTRDISMVMKKEIMVGQVEEIIEKKGGKLVEKYELFDIYEGSQIMAGYKSVAYSITFRAADRTLEDREVQNAMDHILKALQELGIELRK